MTPLLLTLAGMLPGDGGPAGGAARQPVLPPLTVNGAFRGFLRYETAPACPVDLSGGVLRLGDGEDRLYVPGCTLAPDGEGRFLLTFLSSPCRGSYRRQGDRFILTLDGEGIETLPRVKRFVLLEALRVLR
jgi:hypothetical protein